MAHSEWFGAIDPEVARLNADKCGETIDWLEELGVPFEEEVGPHELHRLARRSPGGGQGRRDGECHDRGCESAGVSIETKTAVTKLVKDADGRVCGHRAMKGREPVRIKAEEGRGAGYGRLFGQHRHAGCLCPANKNLKLRVPRD